MSADDCCAGLIGTLGSLLGRGGLAPILGMAVICLATVFMLACLAVVVLRIRRPEQARPFRVPGGIFTGVLGILGSLFFLIVTIREPYVNAEGLPLEWVLLAAGLILGLAFWAMASKVRCEISEPDRRRHRGTVVSYPDQRGWTRSFSTRATSSRRSGLESFQNA